MNLNIIKNWGLTLTGMDKPEQISELQETVKRLLPSRMRRSVELGLLWSESDQAAFKNRYRLMTGENPFHQAPIWDSTTTHALHVCGSKAQERLLDGKVPVAAFYRIQWNGRFNSEQVHRLVSLYPNVRFVFQYNESTADDWAELGRQYKTWKGENHLLWLSRNPYIRISMLVDASGGRGVLPESWQLPVVPGLEQIDVGFAGGLEPDNLRWNIEAVHKTLSAADFSFGTRKVWFDLEQGLRDEATDTFSLARAEDVICAWFRTLTSLAAPAALECPWCPGAPVGVLDKRTEVTRYTCISCGRVGPYEPGGTPHGWNTSILFPPKSSL